MVKQMKILVAPLEVAGYYRNLCEGFRQLGIPYDFVTYQTHPSGYGGETRQPLLLRMASWLRLYHERRGSPSWHARLFGSWPSRILTSIWAIWAIFHYDVFIFGFGMTLLRDNLDLYILRKLGKTVITNLAHGSDARPPFIDGFLLHANGGPISAVELNTLTQRNMQRVAVHEQLSTVVIGAPFSTSHFASRPFINVFALGMPMQPGLPSDYECVVQKMGRNCVGAVRILHAPSNRVAKGSEQVISAVERLKKKGYLIDFVLIHGRSFQDVLEEIKHCDFVVDQLFCDTPMAGFAAESAWLGKPAIVGGYGLDRLLTYMPEEMLPPSFTCHPDEIEQAIEFLIVNPEERIDLGFKAQRFVRQMWSPSEVAKRYLRLCEGDIPAEWWFDPSSVTYLEGGGQSVERTCENVRNLVAQYGVASLQLSHRPELELAFLDFAEIARNNV